MSKMVLAVIVGNRDFFPDHLVTEARRDILTLLEQLDVEAVILDDDATKLGGVETWQDAAKCAALFKTRRDDIRGVLVSLPNFGDERGVADTLKRSGLDVPILVQAYPDDLDKFDLASRRDAYCGKVSVCNNLRQYGYSYTLTELHTVRIKSDAFRRDLEQFLGVCRVVSGLRGARVGAIGARPGAFNTVRYSEKLLQAYDITVATVDLSEMFGGTERLADEEARVLQRLEGIRGYLPTEGIPAASLLKMAKLGVVIDDWMEANSIDATALQCWNSIQQNFGVNACTLMSMMSDRLVPSACEVDVMGALSMYALQLASGKPSALIDWNNNYGDHAEKCVLFHCSNWPRSFFESARMGHADVLATTLGVENTYGSVMGRVPAGPMSFARLSTDDLVGEIHAYVGEGEFTDDALATFGGRAVVEVPGLQKLMRHICKSGFEHHGAMNPSHSAAIVAEAFETYFGWETYYLNRPE